MNERKATKDHRNEVRRVTENAFLKAADLLGLKGRPQLPPALHIEPLALRPICGLLIQCFHIFLTI